ncbi:hypothetical protein BN14_12036 [Rhizoctonia solani AG-1 IB]|uniref:Uncharacterized protein n=1 Tax=Thanatephorus cucumeris (strain AG1-IB / isolate 7/3/14) TaxID=1108050 RepID=M5CEJ9_THACB|nr:hypothetical protein BN14_12036 [Rhizoctonia solani AG-1 IB]
MANGTRVPSMGTAQAEIEYQGYKWPITFEVLDSRGAFELLIGKDWLSANGQTIYIENSNPDYIPISTASTLVPPTSTEEHKPNIKREADDETQTVEPKPESTEEEANENKYQDGEQEGQQRRVSKRLLERKMRLERRERNPFWVSEQGVMMIERMTGMGMTCDSNDEDDKTLEESWGNAKQEVEEQRQREIMQIERASTTETTNQLKEALRRAKRAKARIRGPADVMALVLESSRPEHEPIPQPPPLESERTTDPFNAERVAEILGKVKLGEALSGEQRHCVKEVLQLKLDVPPEASFPKKVGQKKLTEPQRKALESHKTKSRRYHQLA